MATTLIYDKQIAVSREASERFPIKRVRTAYALNSHDRDPVFLDSFAWITLFNQSVKQEEQFRTQIQMSETDLAFYIENFQEEHEPNEALLALAVRFREKYG